jgi:hypothetical protein
MYLPILIVVFYSAILWPFIFFLPQLWALSADQSQERRGRLLLTILIPFSLLVTWQVIGRSYKSLVCTGCYLLACLLSASWVYGRWLWRSDT